MVRRRTGRGSGVPRMGKATGSGCLGRTPGASASGATARTSRGRPLAQVDTGAAARAIDHRLPVARPVSTTRRLAATPSGGGAPVASAQGTGPPSAVAATRPTPSATTPFTALLRAKARAPLAVCRRGRGGAASTRRA